MRPILTPSTMRAFDEAHIARGVSGLVLMENAGRAAAHIIGLALRPRRAEPTTRGPERGVFGSCVRCADERSLGRSRVLVLAGGGNNGGDGYVVARHLAIRGGEVRVLAVSPPRVDCPDAVAARAAYIGIGGAVVDDAEPGAARLGALLAEADVVVDALVGIGLTGPVSERLARVIEQLNAARLPVFALDTPSGFDAARGYAPGSAIVATHTICFGHLKTGLLTTHGATHAGRITLAHIGVPSELPPGILPDALLLEEADLQSLVAPRPVAANKIERGRVVVVGGSVGMTGAARLAARAALRAGAGHVTIATEPEAARALGAEVEEILVRAISVPLDAEARRLLEGADAVVLGPGLALGATERELVREVLAVGRPTVLDAGGLRLVEGALDGLTQGAHLVMTPHAGEAAGLLGVSSAEVENDRFGAATALSERASAIVVLKGPRTLIHAPGEIPVVSPFGSPALASAGTGDVLAGALGAWLASACAKSTSDAFVAVWGAVALHGLAGELFARAHGDTGLVASELADLLPDARASLVR